MSTDPIDEESADEPVVTVPLVGASSTWSSPGLGLSVVSVEVTGVVVTDVTVPDPGAPGSTATSPVVSVVAVPLSARSPFPG